MVLLVVDPNVLVSGLIAQGPPAEVVDLVRYGEVRAATCPQLLTELEGVLRRPRFRRYVEPGEIDTYLDVLRSITVEQPDPSDVDGIDCRDPDDAYLIALAREVRAEALVSGDRDLTELDDSEPPVLTPAAVLDRWDPVPRRPFPAVRGTFQIVLSGPRSSERRVHWALQAGGFVTQRTSGTEENPSLAWVKALCHGGDHPQEDFQRDRLDQAQAVGAEEGFQLRQHGVVIGGPSEFRIVRHRTSRQEVFRIVANDPDRAVEQLARQLGLPAEDLILEEARGLWDIPRST